MAVAEDRADSHSNREGFWHVSRETSETVLARIRLLGYGEKMQDLPEEMWHDSFRHYVKNDPNRQGGPNLRLIRLDPERPALTVTGYIFNKFAHPYEDRYITPREAARLQDFPDTFLFEGTLSSVRQQIGNAVPVRLAHAVARAVLYHAREHGTLDHYLTGADRTDIPALSLFSGAGGMDLGFGDALRDSERVAFRAVASVENDADCCRTLQLNGLPCAGPLDIKSISEPRAFVREASGVTFVPLVFGGPPCQAFSQAGRQRADEDMRGQLVFDFVRFVDEIRPTYFVMENVRNLRGVCQGRVYEALQNSFRDLGYSLRVYELCAADYGTPQLRVRLFFVGARDPYPPVERPPATHADTDGNALFPGLKPYRTVGDAFASLPELSP